MREYKTKEASIGLQVKIFLEVYPPVLNFLFKFFYFYFATCDQFLIPSNW